MWSGAIRSMVAGQFMNYGVLDFRSKSFVQHNQEHQLGILADVNTEFNFDVGTESGKVIDATMGEYREEIEERFVKAGCEIHGDYRIAKTCKNCLFQYLRKNAKLIQLPHEGWGFVAQDHRIIFAKAENDYTIKLNMIIGSNMNGEIYFKQNHIKWLIPEPESVRDIVESLNCIDKLLVFQST